MLELQYLHKRLGILENMQELLHTYNRKNNKKTICASNQEKSQFVVEIATIFVVQHFNLAKLYGCCIEWDNRLLVYGYHENKSLDQALFATQKKLV